MRKFLRVASFIWFLVLLINSTYFVYPTEYGLYIVIAMWWYSIVFFFIANDKIQENDLKEEWKKQNVNT